MCIILLKHKILCIQKTEERYSVRRMIKDASKMIHISDLTKDELHLLHPDRLNGWYISHQGEDKV